MAGIQRYYPAGRGSMKPASKPYGPVHYVTNEDFERVVASARVEERDRIRELIERLAPKPGRGPHSQFVKGYNRALRDFLTALDGSENGGGS